MKVWVKRYWNFTMMHRWLMQYNQTGDAFSLGKYKFYKEEAIPRC